MLRKVNTINTVNRINRTYNKQKIATPDQKREVEKRKRRRKRGKTTRNNTFTDPINQWELTSDQGQGRCITTAMSGKEAKINRKRAVKAVNKVKAVKRLSGLKLAKAGNTQYMRKAEVMRAAGRGG